MRYYLLLMKDGQWIVLEEELTAMLCFDLLMAFVSEPENTGIIACALNI